jgi:hypothetical protein
MGVFQGKYLSLKLAGMGVTPLVFGSYIFLVADMIMW